MTQQQPNRHSTPLRIALIGCGAITEQYYAPALQEAGKHTSLEVTALFDPAQQRLDAVEPSFPRATPLTEFEALIAARPDLAIVASPPKFHAAQTIALLRAGVHVLCEKPLACTLDEANQMVAAAQTADRLLAVGLFRRFFPALQTIKALVAGGALGAPTSFHFAEGGAFNWPAASASFFQKQHSQGGVLLDLGVHLLDLSCWWFGAPASITYADDAMGNLEANSQLQLTFTSGLKGEVRLSRDTPCSNRYVIEFEQGKVVWHVGDANHLDVRFKDSPFPLTGELREQSAEQDQAADSYHHSFVRQILNVVAAARGLEPLRVPAAEAISSLRLIEHCYANRQLIPMPWLSPAELERAQALATKPALTPSTSL
jgi:predicted dehydrogenase